MIDNFKRDKVGEGATSKSGKCIRCNNSGAVYNFIFHFNVFTCAWHVRDIFIVTLHLSLGVLCPWQNSHRNTGAAFHLRAQRFPPLSHFANKSLPDPI